MQHQLASGHYDNASEVLRDALRLIEERERKLATLDAAIEHSIADIEAARVHDASEVFDELEAQLERFPAIRPYEGSFFVTRETRIS